MAASARPRAAATRGGRSLRRYVAWLLATVALGAWPTQANALTDLAPAAGIGEVTVTHGATVFDYDADGLLDIVISRHAGGFPRIWHANPDGTYSDQGDSFVGPVKKADYHRCSWIDVQQDGRNDLFCAVGGSNGGDGPDPSQLWIANADGTYSERAAEFRADAKWGRTRDAAVLDANRDGWPDLYLGNLRPRADGRRAHNMLLLNDGGERFLGAPSWGVNRILGSYHVQAADYNADGRTDLLACGQEGLRLFRNEGSRFSLALARSTCADAELTQVKGGPRLDLVRLTTRGLALRAGGPSGFRPARVITRRQGIEFAVGQIGRGRHRDVYLLRKGRDILLYGKGRRGFRARAVRREPVGAAESVAYVADRLAFLVLSGYQRTPGRVALLTAGSPP